MLYFRMLLLMLVAIYTSRVVLQVLGVEDYGIYNVVGGVVAMMGILNGAMAVSTQRYLTFELGKGDKIRLKQVFSVSLTIYFMFAGFLLLLAETVGLWFLNNRLVIPVDRMLAANWVYQFSLLSSVVTLLYTPFNAAIIAHEKMNVYACLSIIEVFLKLVIIYTLMVVQTDKLIVYGLLLMLISIIVTLSYIVYCGRHYAESKYKFYWDKELFVELMSYSGWNMFGSTAALVKGHGVSILLNMFFSPAVNAACGLATQVNTAVSQFFSNFYMSVRPQITKYYAQDDLENMFKLVFRSSRMSFFLILFISLPLLVETPFVIRLWLGQIPEYVVEFIRLILLITAVDAMATPLMTSAHASGHIKLYQSLVGSITLLIIPVSYLFLRMGAAPEIVFYISLFVSIMNLFVRLWIVRRLMPLPVNKYIKEVFGRCVLCASLAAVFPLMALKIAGEGFGSFFFISILCVLCSSIAIWTVGLDKDERIMLATFIKNKFYR